MHALTPPTGGADTEQLLMPGKVSLSAQLSGAFAAGDDPQDRVADLLEGLARRLRNGDAYLDGETVGAIVDRDAVGTWELT